MDGEPKSIDEFSLPNQDQRIALSKRICILFDILRCSSRISATFLSINQTNRRITRKPISVSLRCQVPNMRVLLGGFFLGIPERLNNCQSFFLILRRHTR